MASNNGAVLPDAPPPPAPGVAAAQAAMDDLIAQAAPPGPAASAAATPADHGLHFIDSAQFQQAHYPLRWLIPGVLVRGQPAVLGGPRKALKTSVLVDLALSLGARIEAPFLDRFPVETRVRVGLMSGESGEAALQEIARRIATSKRICLAAASVHWCFRLPQLGRPGDLAALRSLIGDLGLEVVIIDPLYLCLFGAGDDANAAANLFRMGPLLADVSRACLEAGATPILAHHARKNRGPDERYEPLELEDLAFAGIQEFARQWLLLGRREAYVPGTGMHRLWLGAGGSAGHSGLWGVDVYEGPYDDEDGRWWGVTVTTADEARAAAVAAKQGQKESAHLSRVARDAANVVDFLRGRPAGETRTAIRESLGISGGRVGAAVLHLLKAGEVVETEITKNGKMQTAIRLAHGPGTGT